MTIYTVGKEVLSLYEDYKEDAAVAINAKGNAECALLVQKLTSAPNTGSWKRGDKVRSSNVTAGTAIATFKDDGFYDGNSGVCHAAIFVALTATGVKVWDQWKTGHIGERKANGYFHGIRVCTFKDATAKLANGYRRQNDGDEFYVVELK